MKHLFTTTALVCLSTLAAQAAAPKARNDGGDCKRLVTAVQQKQIDSSKVTLQQARTYLKNSDETDCVKILAANDSDAADKATGGKVDIDQPATQLRVQQPSANIQVHQSQPQVSVNQPAPTIDVRQPAPTVTVNIPEPIITVHMPKPNVDVTQAKPQVSINQPQPQVSVVQPQDKAQVDVTKQAADVSVTQSDAQPNIRFQSDKAKVVVNQPNGQPKINVVQDDDNDGANVAAMQAGNSNDAGASQQAMATPAADQNVGSAPMAVSKILGMDL